MAHARAPPAHMLMLLLLLLQECSVRPQLCTWIRGTRVLPGRAAPAHGRARPRTFKGDAVDHVQRVDDVAERLAHLAAVRVADHGVQVHLGSRRMELMYW